MLRRKRLGVRRTREAKRRRKQQLDAVGKAECGAALQDVSTINHEFQLYLKETHTKATARLQALNYECIAEMKKALIRMESISAHTTQESEVWQKTCPDFSTCDGICSAFRQLNSGVDAASSVPFSRSIF
ncbi:hypothetical protein PInf_023449 [Phytophthora infestans]|nr:hypothetical protein PInf_023449 [Phytophthora infestans]